MDEADRLFAHGRGDPRKFGLPLRWSMGESPDGQRLEDAARVLGRPVYFVDADGYECEIIGAALHADGDIAYVESRAKDVGGHVDMSIRIHLVRKSGGHDAADIESYNPFFGCDVRFFEWIGAAAVLIYREKHWTFACCFGDVWPPTFVKIEDDWAIDGGVLSYLGYKEQFVRRLNFPALEAIDPIPVAVALETDLFPAVVKERYNRTLQRTDPVFGELRGYRMLMAKATMPALGGRVPVLIDTDGKPTPDDAQRVAFTRAAAGIGPDAVAEAVAAMFANYREVAEIYREGLSAAEVQSRVPEVADAEEFAARTLSEPSVYVPAQPPSGRRLVMFDWQSTWEEDGLRAFFVDERFVRCGTRAQGWDDLG